MAAKRQPFGTRRARHPAVSSAQDECASHKERSMTETEPKVRQAEEAEPDEGLFWGRPAEDRAFETVEIVGAAAAGAAIGTAGAGPVGTAVGGIVGGAAGFLAGEALERHEGRAAKTTDATEHEPPSAG
jgi:hypothetical protein